MPLTLSVIVLILCCSFEACAGTQVYFIDLRRAPAANRASCFPSRYAWELLPRSLHLPPFWTGSRRRRHHLCRPDSAPAPTCAASQIDDDVATRLRTANEYIPVGRSVEWRRVVDDRSRNQAAFTAMTHTGPARPANRNVARFGEL